MDGSQTRRIEDEAKHRGKTDRQADRRGQDESPPPPDDGDDDAGEDKPAPPKKPMSTTKKILLIATAVIVVIVVAIAATLWWLDARRFEGTDDAFIDGHISIMATQVAGRVTQLAVDDNQMVAAGALLVQIDPRDYQVKLDQAIAQQAQSQAQVAQARAQATLQQATIEQQGAQVQVAEADLTQAQQDFARFRNIDPKAITRQQYDNASATTRSAQAKLDAARYGLSAAQAQLVASQAQIANAQAALTGAGVAIANARLQLSYTALRAPQAGRVTKRSVEVGNYVTPGQALLDIVPPGMWVTANFKETQLALMKVGQPVNVAVDAIPGHVFHGHVDSFQSGSGSVFSTLPAENATGNYVKVVQRLPVKIVLDEANDPRLALGLSVSPSVTVR